MYRKYITGISFYGGCPKNKQYSKLRRTKATHRQEKHFQILGVYDRLPYEGLKWPATGKNFCNLCNILCQKKLKSIIIISYHKYTW